MRAEQRSHCPSRPPKGDALAGSAPGRQGQPSGNAKSGRAQFTVAGTVTGDFSRAGVVHRERERQRLSRQHAPLHVTSPARIQRLRGLLDRDRGAAAESQRARILSALRGGPLTTIEIRQYLDVLAVGARIWELVHLHDHRIVMQWVVQVSPAGHRHRVAMYTLMRGP